MIVNTNLTIKTCNLNKKWNNDKCQCKCKKCIKLAKDYNWILNLFFCENSMYLKKASIKHVRSKGEGGDHGKSIHVLFLSYHSIIQKRTRGRERLEKTKFERTYFIDGPKK